MKENLFLSDNDDYETLFAETSFFKNNVEMVKFQLADYKSKISGLEIPENVKV